MALFFVVLVTLIAALGVLPSRRGGPLLTPALDALTAKIGPSFLLTAVGIHTYAALEGQRYLEALVGLAMFVALTWVMATRGE